MNSPTLVHIQPTKDNKSLLAMVYRGRELVFAFIGPLDFVRRGTRAAMRIPRHWDVEHMQRELTKKSQRFGAVVTS